MADQAAESKADVKAWLKAAEKAGVANDLGRIPELDMENLISFFQDLTTAIVDGRSIGEALSQATPELKGIVRDELTDVCRAIMAYTATLPEVLTVVEGIALFAEKQLLEPSLKSVVQNRLKVLHERGFLDIVSAHFRSRADTESAIDAAVPRIKGMWTRCIQVSRFEPEYKINDDVDEYDPKIAERIPITVIQVDIDEFGDVNRISVGLTEEELTHMIKRLKFAQKQLKLMMESE